MFSGDFPGEAKAGRAFLMPRDSSLALDKGVGRAVRAWGSVQGDRKDRPLMGGPETEFRRPLSHTRSQTTQDL